MIPYDMRPATKEEIAALPYSEPFRNGSLRLFYTSSDDEFMTLAREVIMNSTDKRHPTAAVVVKDGKVLASAANQSGFKHPYLIRLHEIGWCVRKLFRVRSGAHYWLCPGCANARDHAESRASKLALAKYPQRMMNTRLYLYGHWWCCKDCCEAMEKTRVREVVLLEGASRLFK